LPGFVVHEHWASQHHFDFRLEMDGVLKSWAVPKGPPILPGIKRLAMQVDDHPLDYASFEGTIPAGHYGAGKVEIWDKGDYVLNRKTSKEIRFSLRGAKLRGEYALVLMRVQEGKAQWLLLRLSPAGLTSPE
jgi:bifunctional non-homologous end joining protein LigD